MAPAGFIAVLAGWTTTEVGRQPFTVYGLLRTADSMSPIGACRRSRPRWSPSSWSTSIVFGAGLVFLLRMMRASAGGRRERAAADDPAAHRRHHAGAGAGREHARPGETLR